jgi:hypothetical protein
VPALEVVLSKTVVVCASDCARRPQALVLVEAPPNAVYRADPRDRATSHTTPKPLPLSQPCLPITADLRSWRRGFLDVSRSELPGQLRRLREAGVLVCKGGRLQPPARFYDERAKYGVSSEPSMCSVVMRQTCR